MLSARFSPNGSLIWLGNLATSGAHGRHSGSVWQARGNEQFVPRVVVSSKKRANSE